MSGYGQQPYGLAPWSDDELAPVFTVPARSTAMNSADLTATVGARFLVFLDLKEGRFGEGDPLALDANTEVSFLVKAAVADAEPILEVDLTADQSDEENKLGRVRVHLYPDQMTMDPGVYLWQVRVVRGGTYLFPTAPARFVVHGSAA